MTWQEAKEHALKNIALIKTSLTQSSIDPTELKGQKIPIVEYKTREDFETLRPEDKGKLTHLDHNQIIKATQRLIRAELKAKPILVRLKSSHYLRWLARHTLDNTADNRAHFIALQQQEQSQIPKIIIGYHDKSHLIEERVYIIQPLETFAIAEVIIKEGKVNLSIWTAEPWHSETDKEKFIKQAIKNFKQERHLPLPPEKLIFIERTPLHPPGWITALDPKNAESPAYIIKTTNPPQITQFTDLPSGELQGIPLIYTGTQESINKITQLSHEKLILNQ